MPFASDGQVAGSDAAAQTLQVLRNLDHTLESAGASRRDVVSTIIYLTNIADINAVDAVYRDYFGQGPFPARTTVEVSALGRPEFRVEISAVAKVAAAGD